MQLECPHCKVSFAHKAVAHINVDKTPEMRKKVQDLSVFRAKCPNCYETMLAVSPCLYHDMSEQFMVWLWPEGTPPSADLNPLAGYTLRLTDTLNAFREKICILEQGLDDRAIELMKLLLFMQLTHDLDLVELVFHEYDEKRGEFRFVAVLSDGAEQYAAMPGALYMRMRQDVEERLYTTQGEFVRIDLQWAMEAMELLRAAEG